MQHRANHVLVAALHIAFLTLVTVPPPGTVLGNTIEDASQARLSDPGTAEKAGGDLDGDGVPDAQDNCPTVPNPGQENTDLTLDDGFECGELTNWSFTYSTNGQQSGSAPNGAAVWSSEIVPVPAPQCGQMWPTGVLSGLFGVRLFADSPLNGWPQEPFRADAAIDVTVTTIEVLEANIQFDQIQGMGGNGLSYFQIAVIDSSNPAQSVSYAYSTSGNPPGDFDTVVTPGAQVAFSANVADDYFDKYGTPLSGSAILRFLASADYAESAGGNEHRTTEVRLDDIRVIAPDADGDVCDYCAPVHNDSPDPFGCLAAVGQALDLPGAQSCNVSFTGDARSLAVTTRFGGIRPSMGENLVVMCTGDVLQPLAEPGTPLAGDDSAILTMDLQPPRGACESDGTPCGTHADCMAGDVCAKSNYYLQFCFQLLTAEYPETTGPLGETFGDTFRVTLEDPSGITTLVEYSSSSPPDPPITPAYDSLVSGAQFEIPTNEPDCRPDAGFVRQCLNFNVQNLNTDTVTLRFAIEDTVNPLLDTCVILDFLQLTNLKVVDPNPDFLDANGAIKTDPEEIDDGGRDVGGAAADGVTRVLLREEVALPGGQVQFCLDSGTAPQDGGLSRVGESGLDQCVCACVETTGEFPDFKYYAFAVYHTPPEFNRGGANQGEDSESAERQVDFRSTWHPICIPLPCESPASGNCLPVGLDNQMPFKLVRPPLVLVHGLWSSGGTWDKFLLKAEPQKNERYTVTVADYAETSGAHLTENNTVVPTYIKKAVEKLRDKQPQLAVTQADVGAHSMGGVLSRDYIAKGSTLIPNYEYKENFFAGDIHKLVTLDTPHLGSPIANFLKELGDVPCYERCVVNLCAEICVGAYAKAAGRALGKPIDKGAIEDLRVCSSRLKQIPATNVPGHACIGNITESAWEEIEFKLIDRVCKIIRFICRARDLINFFCVGCNDIELPSFVDEFCSCDLIADFISNIIGRYGGGVEQLPETDGIVGVVSQRGGMVPLPSAMTVFTDIADGLHTNNTSSPMYSDRLEALLNTAATTDKFGNWPSVTSQCPPPPANEGFIVSDGQEDPIASTGATLKVVFSPTGCPVKPDTVSYLMTVSRGDDSTVPLDTVHVVGADSLAVAEYPDGFLGPFTVCFDIPPEYNGGYQVRAFALDDNGDALISGEVVLSAVPAVPDAVLIGVRCFDDQIILQALDDEKQMTVFGVHADGISREITDLPTLDYFSMNESVVTFETDSSGTIPRRGILRANSPGIAVVAAGHVGAGCCTILVTVLDGIRPGADAGDDQEVFLGDVVTLMGSAVCDAESCPESPAFQWEQISGPPVTLNDATAQNTTFLASVAGEYRFQLLVDGGNLLSLPDTVTINAVPDVGNAIPVASEWGVVVMALMLAGAGTFLFRKARAA